MAKDTQIQAMAEAVIKLADEGKLDPNADEIARKYYGDVVIGRAEVAIVRGKLPQVRRIIDEEFERDCCLVNESYYRRSRPGKWGANRRTPDTVTDAQKCLPMGTGMRSEGILVVTDPDNLIWWAARQHDGRVAAGGTRRFYETVQRAYERGLVSEAMVASARRELETRALPSRTEPFEQLRALPQSDSLTG